MSRHSYRWHLGCILLKMPAISLLTGACVPAYAKFPEQGDYWCNASRIVHNATIADNVLQVIPPSCPFLVHSRHEGQEFRTRPFVRHPRR